MSDTTTPEYRTGFDEAPSTFNQEDAAPADYPPLPKQHDWRGYYPEDMRAYVDADRAQRSGVSADPLPLTDTYVQPVPDKCDRITWRGQYYHLPVSSQSQPLAEPVGEILSTCGYKEASWRKGKLPPIGTKLYAAPQPLVEPTADTKPDICYSADGETFHDELSDVFDSLDNQGALVVGGTYHQGEAVRRTAGHYLHDIECLFERMGEVAYDEAGEHKGDWPDNSLKPGEADELKALIKGWLDARVKVWFYTVANVKEVAITEQDLIDYHGPQQHQVKKGELS